MRHDPHPHPITTSNHHLSPTDDAFSSDDDDGGGGAAPGGGGAALAAAADAAALPSDLAPLAQLLAELPWEFTITRDAWHEWLGMDPNYRQAGGRLPWREVD